MRLPRFRLRTLMIAVAVVAVIAWFPRLRRRSKEFSILAQVHAQEANSLLSHANLWDQKKLGGCMEPGVDASGNVDFVGAARKARHQAALEIRLSRDYEHVARYPWLSFSSKPQ